MNTKFKDFPRGYTEDQLLFLIWKELSGGESGEAGLMNSGRRGFPDGLDRKDLLYLIWKALSGGKSLAEVSDITAIPASVLDDLQVGDAVAKVTGKQRHLYVVTYKGEGAGEGICLTYAAAGYGETVSYDRSGSGWVYNSTDVETYSGDGGGGGGSEQVQADWEQSDDTAVDFIKNKPDILGQVIVHGTIADGVFTPGDRYDDPEEVFDVAVWSILVNGGNVSISTGGEGDLQIFRAVQWSWEDEVILFLDALNDNYIIWPRSSSDTPDEPVIS